MTEPDSTSTILDVIAGAVAEVMDEDLAALPAITRETVFATDIELESIELVAMAELLQNEYGEALDLASWLSSLELNEVSELTVGQLVDHIYSSTASGVNREVR